MEGTKFDRDTLNQEKYENVTDSTSTVRPVCGHESTERCVHGGSKGGTQH